MINLIQNEQYLVSNTSEQYGADYLYTSSKFYYLFTGSDGIHHLKAVYEDGTIGVVGFKYIFPIPKKKRVNYEFDTFKLGWLIRDVVHSDDWESLVVFKNDTCIKTLSSTYDWQEVADICEVSKDNGDTWEDGYMEVEE